MALLFTLSHIWTIYKVHGFIANIWAYFHEVIVSQYMISYKYVGTTKMICNDYAKAFGVTLWFWCLPLAFCDLYIKYVGLSY